MTTTATWREQLAPLRYLAATVARVHGPTHPDMTTLASVVSLLADSADGDPAAQHAFARRLHELSGGFQPWPGACGSVAALFDGLRQVSERLA